MENGLSTCSTKELVESIHGYCFKYRAPPLNDILDQLVRRALTLLQAVELAQSDNETSQAGEDPGAGELGSDAESELELLYDSRCCSFLVGLLGSKAASTKVLAGATYLLAIMTAGGGSHAEGWREQIMLSCGIVRLVALLTASSSAVRFNSLLVLVNFLRHEPSSHAEMRRLGAIRKLATMFGEAKEELQQNLCVNAFSLLCMSEVEAITAELISSGCVAQVVSWLSSASSTRVAMKALSACIGLLDKGPSVRSAMLQQAAVRPMMAFIGMTKDNSLRASALEALAVYCGDDTAGKMHREQVRTQDNLLLLCSLVDSTEDPEVLLQVLRVLAICAAFDRDTREALTELDCASKLDRLMTRGQRSSASVALADDGLVPLSEEHIAVIRLLKQVCRGKRGLLVECRSDDVSSPVKAGGRVAARVGAD